MEILSEVESSRWFMLSMFFLCLFFVFIVLAYITSLDDGYAQSAMLMSAAVASLLLFIAYQSSEDKIITYEAIVSDWNYVHEQGYELIETRGNISVLIKEEN